MTLGLDQLLMDDDRESSRRNVQDGGSDVRPSFRLLEHRTPVASPGSGAGDAGLSAPVASYDRSEDRSSRLEPQAGHVGSSAPAVSTRAPFPQSRMALLDRHFRASSPPRVVRVLYPGLSSGWRPMRAEQAADA